MSSRVMPCASRRRAACDVGCCMMAARTSPDCTSCRPALCTWSTAVWSTRRNASVCSGSRCCPRGKCSTEFFRNVSSSRRICGRSAPHASRMRSPSVSCARAYRRCSSVRCVCLREVASRYATVSTSSSEELNMGPFTARGGLFLFQNCLQRKTTVVRAFLDGRDLRLGDLKRIQTAEPFPLGVHLEHDAERLCGCLVENRLQHVHDKIHRRVVVVQQEDPIEIRLLGLLARSLEDLSPGLALGLPH